MDDTAFNNLFSDLSNSDPYIRTSAKRQLAKNREAIQRIESIYNESVNSNPLRASLAGRVLGVKLPINDDLMINAESTQMMYDISASFIYCPCAHCDYQNRGIAAPPNGALECFFTQPDDKGIYTVPVLCDECGKIFFVVWDIDPRN